MKSFNFIAAAALAAVLMLSSSCGEKAIVKGTVEGAPSSEIVVSLLNVNTLETIDTIKTDAHGAFSVKVDVKKGCPEFVYLHRAGVKIAPVLVQAGDRISVQTDTLGNFSVSGSEEAEIFAQAERDFAEFTALLDSLALAEDFVGVRKEYINYYRGRQRFIGEHPFSMALVPVLYQSVGDGVPVFGQVTDAIVFKSVCDSLETVYPESRYVKALRSTADKRMNLLTLQMRVDNAETVAYPDIELPDINAKMVKLSEVNADLVMIHFWSLDAEQKMFNLDTLVPLYEKYHPKGLEIYQVALESDKTGWASTMKAQKLPWINVCDVAEASSKYIQLYMIPDLPCTFFIKNGEVVDESTGDYSTLGQFVGKLLE